MKILVAILLQASFLALTLVTGVFGGGALLQMYRAVDKSIIIFIQIATLAALIFFGAAPVGMLLFGIWLTIDLYTLLHRKSFFERTLIPVLIATTLLFAVFYFGSEYFYGQSVWEHLKEALQGQLSLLPGALKETPLDLNRLVYQLPSGIFILLGINLWIAILFESRSTLSPLRRKIKSEVKSYRAPDELIWALIFSLLFAFIETPVKGLQEAASNILNMVFLVYFFQGLSLLSFMLEKLKFNAILKLVVYFMFILQILLPICLGVFDFWLNFRAKISKKAV